MKKETLINATCELKEDEHIVFYHYKRKIVILKGNMGAGYVLLDNEDVVIFNNLEDLCFTLQNTKIGLIEDFEINDNPLALK